MKIFSKKIDSNWELFGQNDPYYGVYTIDKFRKENLTDEIKEEFFSSGYYQVNQMIENIAKYVDPLFAAQKALEFGCGVGRLTIPLSKVVENVTGIDVSASMLNEARINCEVRSIKNVKLIKSDDNLSNIDDKYDLIYSFIVFQHIPVKKGEHIFKNLLTHLNDEGVCVLHFTYARENKNIIKKYLRAIRKYFPFAENIINIAKGESFFNPHMQMNSYNLNRLISIIYQEIKVKNLFIEHTNHGGTLGIVLYFKRQGKD